MINSTFGAMEYCLILYNYVNVMEIRVLEEEHFESSRYGDMRHRRESLIIHNTDQTIHLVRI